MAALVIEILGLLYALFTRDLIFGFTCLMVIFTHLILSYLKLLKPIFLFLFPGIIILFFSGNLFDLFKPTSEYDSVLHFYTGLTVSLLFASIFIKKLKLNPLYIIFLGLWLGLSGKSLKW